MVTVNNKHLVRDPLARRANNSIRAFLRHAILHIAAAAALSGCALERTVKNPESHQFDFLIGSWTVQAERTAADGSILRYQGRWTARLVDDGRMVMDEFRANTGDGEWLSTFVTLRTYSPATRRWEIAGLAALQPAAPVSWHGEWRQGEMHMDAEGVDPQGRTVQTRIRFFDIEPGRFSWESQASIDKGSRWFPTARLTAVRATP